MVQHTKTGSRISRGINKRGMNKREISNQERSKRGLNWRGLVLVGIALFLLVMIWETNRSDAAVNHQAIPEESIRLRILANSDSPRDQWVKREVRDAIMSQMESWAVGPQSLDEARGTIRAYLPELQQLVGQTLEANDAKYPFTVELAEVPFPAKVYNGKTYPAGNYESLRVTLGVGDGQNWWCVLFPPLCFVDVVSTEKANQTVVNGANPDSGSAENETEYRSYVWDFLKSMF